MLAGCGKSGRVSTGAGYNGGTVGSETDEKIAA